ncbi:bifunctional DNA primase/polymerase [Proteus mirabilis]
MDNFIFQDTAIFLATNNIPIHPLIAGTKRPVDKGWSNAPSLTFDNIEKQITLWITKGYGLGARTGYPLSNGALFYVIDVDIHGEALTTEITHELHTQLYNLGLDPNLPNVITGRGNGSCHYYVSVPNSKLTTIIGAAKTICKSKYVHEGKPYWIIEVLGKGKQVVVPPTIHPETNKPYLLKSLKITEASKELLDTLTDIMTTKTQLFQSNNSNHLPNEIRQKCAQLFDKAIASFDIEADITKLKSALEAINADCSYDIWRNVIWAICAHNIMDGISIAKNWSKTSNKYEEYTFNAVWDSYNPSGGINAGTLYYIANEGNDSNLLIVFYVQIMPDDFVMQLHRF